MQVVLLRGALLALKLATISAAAKGAASATAVLWRSLQRITMHIQGYHATSLCYAESQLDQHFTVTAEVAAEQQQFLSTLIVQLLVPSLRQSVSVAAPEARFGLMLLSTLMTTGGSLIWQAVATDIVHLDATLYSGGAGRDDLHDVDVEQHFDMVQSVIQLMTQLLRQSQWQTPDSSFGNTTDIAQAPSVNGASTEAIDSQAVHADNLSADADSWMASSCEAPGWPTPSAATWADINAAATRAAFTLETLAPQLAPDSTSVSAKQLELSLALIGLLHSLLAGHIMDPQLDMPPVFLFAMIPLLQGTC
ncbi:TPA: hypothetical protein ACH3X3_004490 [Trebouxia sp. C0006]